MWRFVASIQVSAAVGELTVAFRPRRRQLKVYGAPPLVLRPTMSHVE
jgi:hypothetical protein